MIAKSEEKEKSESVGTLRLDLHHDSRIASVLFMMQNDHMRTTVNLDEATHSYASYYAQARGLTLGAAIDELVRKAQATPSPAVEIQLLANGLPAFPPSGRTVTCEEVNRLAEEEG